MAVPSIDGFADILPLATGGFGTVYRAVRTSTGGAVALKVLNRQQTDEPDLLERRLRRELAAMVALKGHPNIVQVEEVVSTSDGPAIVMEYMQRGSVLTARDTRPRAAFAAQVGASIAAGLEAAHDAGIVHRDVKPQNILRNDFGQVKLCDFGIAALMKAPGHQTRTTSLSVQYASPEELDDAPDIGPPTDVYSLGASLYHLMTGQAPTFKSGRLGDPNRTRLGSRRDPIAARVGIVVEGCMELEPADRPTAREIANLLGAAADTGPRSEPGSARADQEGRDDSGDGSHDGSGDDAPSSTSEDHGATVRRDRTDGRDHTPAAGRSIGPSRPAPPTSSSPVKARPAPRPQQLPDTSTEGWWT